MAKTCPNCRSSEFDVDPARGDTVCTNCGIVLEENAIVSEVTIQENADGSSSVVGQFVSSEGSYKPYLSGFQYGLRKESRQITLDAGKQEIRDLAGMLNLNRHCVDTAFNFFKMAISKRLSRGRRIKHIVAACVYMTCRTEATPHLLLDFSDVTQVNVFTLGRTFLMLAKELHINLPVLDPCIYITRFAHRLDFGDKTHDVSMTAMRLLARMKRDWLHTGRRPSGVCGAALLVAARLHGYTCSVFDMVRVVKIGGETIRKRLTEFDCTPSSKLTISEFMEIDLEAEHDPPAFINNRIKAKLQQLEAEAGGMSMIENEIGKISDAIDTQLMPPLGSNRRKTKSALPHDSEASLDEEKGDNEFKAAAKFVHAEDPLKLADQLAGSNYRKQTEDDCGTDSSAMKTFGPAPTAASLGLRSSVSECMSLPVKDVEDGADDAGILDLNGIDEVEIDNMLLSPEECAIKTRIWMEENGDFLKELEEKKEQQQDQEKKKKKNRKSKGISRKEYYGDSKTAGEAIEKLIARQKRLSNKINYEALRKATEEVDTPADPAPPLIIEEVPTRASREMKRTAADDDDGVTTSKKRAVTFLDLEDSVSKPTEQVVIESGTILPPAEEEEEEEEDEDDLEDESCMSVTQLMRHSGVVDGGYGVEADDVYDYD